jgi:sugar-phosphatase
MRGVISLLDMLDRLSFKIGLATSSPTRMVTALLEHFGIAHRFQSIISADVVKYGKPHPAVFLHCAESLGSSPHHCLVLEDSVNGAIAGKAARMKVIAVPDELHFDDPRFTIADRKLRSLEELDETTLLSL